MIMDNFLLFDSIGLAITVTRDSLNELDLNVARDMGIGYEIEVVVQVHTTFTASGAATLVTAIHGAPDNGSGAPGSYTILATTDAIGKAALVAGAEVLRICIPKAYAVVPRFLKLVYTVATGPMTAGKVNAFLTLDRQAALAYPSGYVNTYI